MDNAGVLRLNGGAENDPIARELTCSDFTHLYPFHRQRLTGVDAIALRHAQGENFHAGQLQKVTVAVGHRETLLRLAVPRNQLQRGALPADR